MDFALSSYNLSDEDRQEYLNVKRQYIAFVNEYNDNKIKLNEEQFHWLKVLNGKWKSASLNKSLNYFFDMKECHNYLNFMLSKESLNERWKDYIQDFMKWRLKMAAIVHMKWINLVV